MSSNPYEASDWNTWMERRKQAQEVGFGPEYINLQQDMNVLKRQMSDIQKTLDTMQFMEKLQNSQEMSKWLHELGFNNFSIINIMNQINKQRKDR